MASFLHAAAMTTAQGVSARRFLPYAEQIASLLPQTFAGLAAEVDARSYPGTEDRLAMELAALEHIVATSAELGLDGGLPQVLRDLAARGSVPGTGRTASRAWRRCSVSRRCPARRTTPEGEGGR
ncbi:hypothetical protein FHE66_12380 [Georgenia sp. 311]|nr:hypothetical protein [Georgenia sp. 311]TNC17085.1 hypothetical protein FHE66_12380 [Georgenia sp. 311]